MGKEKRKKIEMLVDKDAHFPRNEASDLGGCEFPFLRDEYLLTMLKFQDLKRSLEFKKKNIFSHCPNPATILEAT